MSTSTPRQAERLAHPEAEHLRMRRQWAILRPGDPRPATFSSHPLCAGLELAVHPDARVAWIGEPSDGRRLVLIGIAVHPERPALPATEWLRPALEPARDLHGEVVERIVPLSGTYVVVAVGTTSVSVYTDPASMSSVYHHLGRAASSPSLLPALARDPDLASAFPFRGANDWYPGDLTPFLGVRCLIANHVLRLPDSTVARFWPVSIPDAGEGPSDSVARIAELLRGTVRGLVREAPLLCSITGGRDSRVSLAAARDHVDEIGFFTLQTPEVKHCDIEGARGLARIAKLDHRFVAPAPCPPWLLEHYDEISGGMAIGSRRDVIGACLSLAGPRTVHLNGNLGALTKSYFWPHPRPRTVRTRTLAREFETKPPRILEAIEGWRSTVPPLAATTVYNLMYLEQRGGRWMAPGEAASQLFYDSATVFNSRAVFELICGLPRERQYGGGLLVDLVRELWPELLSVPYCPVTRGWGTYIPKPIKERIKRTVHALSRGRR